MGSWSGVRVARKISLAEGLRARLLAERLIHCERFLAVGRGRVFEGQEDALVRMEKFGFSGADRRGVVRLLNTLTLGTVSEKWVRGYHATLKQRLAEIVGCEPEEIEATTEGVRQLTKA